MFDLIAGIFLGTSMVLLGIFLVWYFITDYIDMRKEMKQ